MMGKLRLFGVILILALTLVLVFAVLTVTPDGSGTYTVKHTGVASFHFGGKYTLDDIYIGVSENTILPSPFLIWESGELKIEVVMAGPQTYSDSHLIGTINDPLLDTEVGWSVTFTSVVPGHYTIYYKLFDGNSVAAQRTITRDIGI